jgi:L-threonylcarbamoyladenylate synthase
MALAYFDNPPDIVRRFMDSHWPGALTIVAPCNVELVPSRVRGDGKTIGFRMPNHEVPLQIIKEIGVPMLGPSANFHGDPTPYTLESLNPELVALVDWVVPGVCHDNQASTVVDCSVSPYRVIRQGSIVLP